jgi:hypothetical protein
MNDRTNFTSIYNRRYGNYPSYLTCLGPLLSSAFYSQMFHISALPAERNTKFDTNMKQLVSLYRPSSFNTEVHIIYASLKIQNQQSTAIFHLSRRDVIQPNARRTQSCEPTLLEKEHVQDSTNAFLFSYLIVLHVQLLQAQIYIVHI